MMGEKQGPPDVALRAVQEDTTILCDPLNPRLSKALKKPRTVGWETSPVWDLFFPERIVNNTPRHSKECRLEHKQELPKIYLPTHLGSEWPC